MVWPAPMRPSPPGPPMTAEEWEARPEDEAGELVTGRLEEEEVPDALHELTVSWLIRVLGAWLAGRGFLFGSELRLRVGATTGRKADVCVYLPGRRVPRTGALRTPPDVVVEVVTPTPRDERRDRVEKMDDYARFSVRWYWIVDPALGSVEIFELDAAGRYARVIAATQGRIEQIPGCDGLTLDVDALWTELARLDPDEGGA